MYFKDIPKKDLEWMNSLSHGSSTIEEDINDAILGAENMTELKSMIIVYMTDIMGECTQVIRHANAMETPKECTCAGNCGDGT